jgi:hypothetical protein
MHRTLIVVLCLLLTTVVVVNAQMLDFLGEFAPDESGAMLLALGPGSGYGSLAGSYQFALWGDTAFFGTVIYPRHLGFGLDGGARESNTRIGACWIDSGTYGLYIRGAF